VPLVFPSFFFNFFSNFVTTLSNSQVFKIGEGSVFGLAEFKSKDRGIGFNFKLHNAVSLNLKDFETFTFKIEENIYKGKIFVPLGPPPELGI